MFFIARNNSSYYYSSDFGFENVDKSWTSAALDAWKFIYMHELIWKSRSTEKKSREKLTKIRRLIMIPHMIQKNITFYKRFLFIVRVDLTAR